MYKLKSLLKFLYINVYNILNINNIQVLLFVEYEFNMIIIKYRKFKIVVDCINDENIPVYGMKTIEKILKKPILYEMIISK
ncbi:hypothetical protein [Paramaledivibacter caminithermalis]|jgi:hypothetical protein|uniref:Uncharacterized protein n=1 Tax=Paramaledivibacter caminithermalis (strain DSM 15212 / CIP 107654 / DViRD3) TaxID=1121301 RepID=A0A1M6NXD1_PARC5|nr:hypothetical protein [Paramaledivibacter caminithermalis]SHK00343.1 hypothetical protein SAMN02745912_01910 [Paramaledivibacter caminithermalis DSM 15212]